MTASLSARYVVAREIDGLKHGLRSCGPTAAKPMGRCKAVSKRHRAQAALLKSVGGPEGMAVEETPVGRIRGEVRHDTVRYFAYRPVARWLCSHWQAAREPIETAE